MLFANGEAEVTMTGAVQRCRPPTAQEQHLGIHIPASLPCADI